MKLLRPFFVSLIVVLLISCKPTQIVEPPTVELSNFAKLASITHVVSIEKRDQVSHFDENYEIWFKQPIDHNDLSKGTFRQRVFLGFENDTFKLGMLTWRMSRVKRLWNWFGKSRRISRPLSS